MSDDVLFELRSHVAHVQLNRPQVLNAISSGMDRELERCWDEIDSNTDIRVAVLSAVGEKAFCSGGDLGSGEKGEASQEQDRLSLGGGLTGVGGSRRHLRKPLIAAVHGYCLGGGFELAMCADLIVAADNTRFGLPETRIGLIAGSGVLHRALRQLPYRVAMAMILADVRLDARRAHHFGLVNEVVTYSELPEAAARWAEKLTACSPLAQQAAKQAAGLGLDGSLDDALTRTYDLIDDYAYSEDFKEGWRAFAERRPPRWTGT